VNSRELVVDVSGIILRLTKICVLAFMKRNS